MVPQDWNPDKEYVVDEFHKMKVGIHWDSATGQHPIDDITIAKRCVRESFIIEPDTIIIQHREKAALAYFLRVCAFGCPSESELHNMAQGILPDTFMELYVRTLPIEIAIKHKWLDNAVLVCKDDNDSVQHGCLLTEVLM
jgi:hypothetical protein